ncbi:endonuclease domain-containing protein [Mucilaginibacter sp. UR6-1]|uniref:endonuclease domain-containing protein n=1 Tax=Mucilaginibacter sp. UR6-1 TaxID=1435643 RepID=UPI001E474C32|nr:endonuclease domain-containing protein [Mucilaginibacter sp. UR6-1]MCC8410750.1 endonuclease domain-containing protein [Mucilaginibacter sp. UR6-1]
MAKIIPYNPLLKPLAAKLRKNMTFGEVLVWNELKSNKLLGFDFDRQRCIDNYIVDFYCKELMLAIEVDGQSHNNEDSFINDINRQARLKSFGITVLRFTESEVKYDMLNVLRTIESTIINLAKQQPDIELPAGFDRSLLEG